MRITIAAIGKARKGPAADLYAFYAGRLHWPLVLREAEIRKNLEGPARLDAEAALLADAIPDGAILIALDERGRDLSSLELAQRLGNWRDEGRRDFCFLIGGADGLQRDLRARADMVLSLGRMTWPHMMVRPMLAEQLYRAQQILAGHPYHRE